MPFKQKHRNMSESVSYKQIQTFEQTVRQLSEGFMCPSPSHGALLFERLIHPADKDVVCACD